MLFLKKVRSCLLITSLFAVPLTHCSASPHTEQPAPEAVPTNVAAIRQIEIYNSSVQMNTAGRHYFYDFVKERYLTMEEAAKEGAEQVDLMIQMPNFRAGTRYRQCVINELKALCPDDANKTKFVPVFDGIDFKNATLAEVKTAYQAQNAEFLIRYPEPWDINGDTEGKQWIGKIFAARLRESEVYVLIKFVGFKNFFGDNNSANIEYRIIR